MQVRGSKGRALSFLRNRQVSEEEDVGGESAWGLAYRYSLCPLSNGPYIPKCSGPEFGGNSPSPDTFGCLGSSRSTTVSVSCSLPAAVQRQQLAEDLVVGDVYGPTVRGTHSGRTLDRFVNVRFLSAFAASSSRATGRLGYPGAGSSTPAGGLSHSTWRSTRTVSSAHSAGPLTPGPCRASWVLIADLDWLAALRSSPLPFLERQPVGEHAPDGLFHGEVDLQDARFRPPRTVPLRVAHAVSRLYVSVLPAMWRAMNSI